MRVWNTRQQRGINCHNRECEQTNRMLNQISEHVISPNKGHCPERLEVCVLRQEELCVYILEYKLNV